MRVPLLALVAALLGLAAVAGPARAAETAAQSLMWPDLIPAEMRGKAVYSPPPVDELDLEAGDLAGMQPQSLGVRMELDGKVIRIPGFVVPLEYDKAHRVTEFFLVPYFGACIHFPPPPPDQMIHVIMPQGLKLNSIYDPFLITGPVKIAVKSSKLGSSEYSIRASGVEPYKP